MRKAQLAIFSLIFFLALGSTSLMAQKKMEEGYIKYTMNMAGGEENPMAGMLNGSEMKVYFLGSQVKTSINMMNGMMNMNIIMDNEAQEGLMLMSIPMMGKNMAVELSKEQMEELKAKQKSNAAASQPTFKYYKRKRKKIAGYRCHKVEVQMPGVSETLTMYVTKKIQPVGQSQIQEQLPGLEGFPLRYEISQGGMKLVFEADEISNKPPKAEVFDKSIPEGYEKTTLEELGGMQGLGGGFGL
ncbi:DUF4412 domain-containing protein [Saprospira grandis]|uniref:DUF4412 domain-containing protein n=1 Tax=Saprospira grandis (strain Lewin) TaxID=984262 RepID=H6L047_SAPGL|nr:DUF4412 domain-containing protein [Saprospira grandis]AFC26211.1 hypothetical protein SGRA_3487 [Saprospira grandis str. Lewin]